MKPTIFVNFRIKNLKSEDLDFLSYQNLQPELYFSGEDYDETTAEKLEKMVQDVSQKNFKPIFHAPFFDLNPGAFDPKIRSVSLERILWSLKVAKQFGATQVVVHPGHGPWVLAKNFPGWLERAKESLSQMVAKAGELGLKIAFENIYDDRPEDLLSLLSLFPKETVGVCFDIGHFNLFGRTSLKNWLDAFGNRIFEIHLHDNLGENDDHIAVGDGTIKFGLLFNWLKNQEQMPILTLEMEQKTHVIKSVQRIKDWFENPN